MCLPREDFLIFPGFRNILRVAINELKLILSFLEVEAKNNTSSGNSLQARILPTVYFAEHITDVFLLNANITRRRSDGVSAACQIILQKPLMVFPPRNQVQFTTKMKKIVNHFRALYGEFADRLETCHAQDLKTNTTLELDNHTFSRAIARYRPDNDVFVGREDAEQEIVA
ncbi:unnamed protein product [Camellia sinensis]